jgi:AraC-like DNA-binding protein
MRIVHGHADRDIEPSLGPAAAAPGSATQFVNLCVLDWELPLEVLRARYTAFSFPMHAHAEYIVAEVTEGTEVFTHRGAGAEAPRGSTIHLNPSESHNGRAAGAAWAYVAAYPSIELLRATIPEHFCKGTPSFQSPVSISPRIRGRLLDFVQGVFSGRDRLWAQTAFLEFVSLLLESGSRRAQNRSACFQSQLRRVREYLDDAPAHNATLLELAQFVSLSPLALLRAFRRQVGSTPYVYRTARRIEVAKALLRESHSIVEVALDCGFADQSHFTTTFRRWTGVTPGQYLHSFQNSRRKDRLA